MGVNPMTEKVVVLKAIRCAGEVVSPKKQLTVGKDLTRTEAKALIQQGKVKWLETKEKTADE